MATTPHLVTPTDAARIAKEQQQRDDRINDLALQLSAVKRHNRRLKQVIRTFLTADKLTAAQRQELISVLAGLEDGRGHAYPLHTELGSAELSLVHHYRTLRGTQRRLVSTLVRQLAVKKGGR